MVGIRIMGQGLLATRRAYLSPGCNAQKMASTNPRHRSALLAQSRMGIYSGTKGPFVLIQPLGGAEFVRLVSREVYVEESKMCNCAFWSIVLLVTGTTVLSNVLAKGYAARCVADLKLVQIKPPFEDGHGNLEPSDHRYFCSQQPWIYQVSCNNPWKVSFGGQGESELPYIL